MSVYFNNYKQRWEVQQNYKGKLYLGGTFKTRYEAEKAQEELRMNITNPNQDLNSLAKKPQAWEKYSDEQIKRLSKNVRYA